jgi:hypothetical protein
MTPRLSYGKCEICDKVAGCNDVPSSELPPEFPKALKRHWIAGKPLGTVVDNQPMRDGEAPESFLYYGGNLVAESICKPHDLALILAAPAMLDFLKRLSTRMRLLDEIAAKFKIEHIYDPELDKELKIVIDLAQLVTMEYEIVLEGEDFHRKISITCTSEKEGEDMLKAQIERIYNKTFFIQSSYMTNILPIQTSH